MSTWVNNQSGQMWQTAQVVSGAISSGGITYGVVASGAVVSGSLAQSGTIFETNIDPNILGNKGNEFWRQIGTNAHLRDSAGASSGSGVRWYLAGCNNRVGSASEYIIGVNATTDLDIASNLYAVPILAGRGGLVQEVGFLVNTPTSTSGANFQMGVYDSMSGGNSIWPGSRLAATTMTWPSSGIGIWCSSGQITSGAVYTWVPSLTVTPGLYWLVLAGNPLKPGPSAVRGTTTQCWRYNPWGMKDTFDGTMARGFSIITIPDNNRYSGNWPLPTTFPTVSATIWAGDIGSPVFGWRF